MMRTRRLGGCVGLAWLASASFSYAQDDAFKAGLDARDDKRWQVVATKMREAIERNSQESTRKVRSGLGALVRQGGMEYLPQYFLGEALFNLNDCAGAVDAWSKSEQQAAVRVRPEFVAQIQQGYVQCEARGVLSPEKFVPRYSQTLKQVNDANALAGTIANLGQANLEIWRADTNMREQYDRAAAEIQNARSRLAAATRTRALRDFNEASAAADRARNMLVSIESNFATAIDARNSVQKLAKDIEQLLGSAESLDRAIDAKKPSLTQAMAAARQGGRDAINRSRERLIAGARSSSAPVLEEARVLAQDAASRLKTVIDELGKIERGTLEARVAEVTAAAQEGFSFVEGAFATFDRLAGQKPASLRPEMSAARDAIQRQVAGARRRFDAARKTEDVAGIRTVVRLTSEARDRLNALITSFGPLTIVDRGVHPALEQGARLFFAGEYQSTLTALSPPDGFPSDIPLQLHVHLFRAAALYALFVRSGEKDQSLRMQALSEIEECRRLNPGFQPDPKAFAPRFISFFQRGNVAEKPADASPASR